MKIRASDDDRLKVCTSLPTFRENTNKHDDVQMDSNKVSNIHCFNQISLIATYCRNSLYFISKTKNKIKQRECQGDENRKCEEENIALKLYLESLNISNVKY